jgi:hypothetical protein
MNKKINLLLFAAIIGLMPLVVAGKTTIGNDVIARQAIDGYSNFTVVDFNNPANKDGALTDFSYWALNSNPFRFVLIDTDNKVRWISDEIKAVATGLNTFSVPTGVAVQKGWNLGVYFLNSGAIAYGSEGGVAKYTSNNSNQPNLNEILSFESGDNRRYSFAASDNINDEPATTTKETATTTGDALINDEGLTINDNSSTGLTLQQALERKQQCANNGWQSFADPAFKNQGQCVARYNQLALDHLENAIKLIAQQISQLIEKIKTLKK